MSGKRIAMMHNHQYFPGVRKMMGISDHFVDVNKMVELGSAARHYYEL